MTVYKKKQHRRVNIFNFITHTHATGQSTKSDHYLSRNIQVDHKVFPRGRPEEKVEVASCQPQRLVAVFGHQDVAVGWNRTPDLEH